MVDTLVFDSAFVSRRGPDVPAFMTAYYKAVALMASQPDEAHAIMARRENMGVQELRDTLSGMHFVSRAEQPALLAPGGPVEQMIVKLTTPGATGSADRLSGGGTRRSCNGRRP